MRCLSLSVILECVVHILIPSSCRPRMRPGRSAASGRAAARPGARVKGLMTQTCRRRRNFWPVAVIWARPFARTFPPEPRPTGSAFLWGAKAESAWKSGLPWSAGIIRWPAAACIMTGWRDGSRWPSCIPRRRTVYCGRHRHFCKPSRGLFRQPRWNCLLKQMAISGGRRMCH